MSTSDFSSRSKSDIIYCAKRDANEVAGYFQVTSDRRGRRTTHSGFEQAEALNLFNLCIPAASLLQLLLLANKSKIHILGESY